MSHPFGETATLITRTITGRDTLGNDVYTAVEVEVPGSVFAPAGSTELVQDQATVISNPTYYLGEFDTDDVRVLPQASDRIRRPNGDVYEVDGEPQIYPPNPFTGRTVGPVVRLEKVTG